ncbi:MAG: serine acetyltransferase [Deltaproteobacteria bacterium]|nr:serine acetyltransferase [Deltaproteobacteria bacterium]
MSDAFEELVDQLLHSYACCGGINHIDGKNLPSKPVIAALTQDLLHVLLPGFWEDRPLSQGDLRAVTTARLESIRDRLEREIGKCLQFQPSDGKTASGLARQFLSGLGQLRELLQTDVEAAFEGDPAAFSVDEIIVAYPGIEATAVQRMAHQLFLLGVPLLPRMMAEWVHGRTGIDIHPGARLGSHFFIDHGTGVVIGQTSEIGSHVRIYQGVTLGALSVSEHVKRDPNGQPPLKKRHPTIQDGVTIYAGATILGGETVIGARSVIGGNVWLTHSVPEDSLVTLEAQQISIKPRPRSEFRI